MNETSHSAEFVKDQKAIYGSELYIEKFTSNYKVGEPDIRAIYKGMPVFAEAKLINEITYKNNYPFKEIQLDNLERKAKSGAMCIGILYKGKEIRYLMYDKLKNTLNKSDWDNAEVFDWQTLRLRWMANIQTNF